MNFRSLLNAGICHINCFWPVWLQHESCWPCDKSSEVERSARSEPPQTPSHPTSLSLSLPLFMAACVSCLVTGMTSAAAAADAASAAAAAAGVIDSTLLGPQLKPGLGPRSVGYELQPRLGQPRDTESENEIEIKNEIEILDLDSRCLSTLERVKFFNQTHLRVNCSPTQKSKIK